jgi:hypothetical protein
VFGLPDRVLEKVQHAEFHGDLSIDVRGELSRPIEVIGIRAWAAMVAAIKIASLMQTKRYYIATSSSASHPRTGEKSRTLSALFAGHQSRPMNRPS